MKLEIPAYVKVLMDQLNDSGYECYIVGGAIRSMLLGLPVHDYDLTTNALPEQMKTVFTSNKTIDTGLKHGTLTVLSSHHPIEITTYRKDSTYQDHRHPDAVQFTSAIEEDCARRDFTINAFCYNDNDGILDFFDGRQDLKNHILRCIGDPSQRFEEDALRILRAVRFASQLHFEIEVNTKNAIFTKKDLLSYISLERIHEEMDGFLNAEKCASYLDTYREVIAVFLPEIKVVPHWDTVLKQIDNAPSDAVVRTAVLFTGLPDSSDLCRRLKYTNAEIKTITSLIKYRDTCIADRVSMRKFLSIYHEDFTVYLHYRSALNPSFAADDAAALYQQIIDHHDCTSLAQLAVSGNDIKALGYSGKMIAEKLTELLNAVMEDQIPNEKEELMKYIKRED